MPATPLLPGDPDRLAGYTLDARLGEGGQGTVYRGHDGAGRVVAVKLLRAALLEDPAARIRFVREFAAAQRVARFCTAQVLDADLAGDRPYIVSEFVEGPSLQQEVAAAGPRRGVELERLAIGTATALAAIHQAGIVHCDLKPANVLLARDGPRVIDFGIARALGASGGTSEIIGTPAYMAPEQISRSAVSPAVDVFAWGAMIAYAVNGSSPFVADSTPSTIYRVLESEPDLGGLVGPMRHLVVRCLSKDPAGRPTSRDVLLELIGGGERATTRPLDADADTDADRTRQILEIGTTQAAGGAAATRALPAGAATRALPLGRPATQALPPEASAPPATRRRGRLVAVLAGVGVLLVAAVVAAVVFFAMPPQPEATSIPAAFAGRWAGSGRLPDEGTDVYPSLVLRRGELRTDIAAGESGCAGGTLSFRRADASTLEMDFRPPSGCPTGIMTFELTGSDQLGMHLGGPEATTTYYATFTR